MGLISVIDCKMGHDQLAVRSFIEDFNSKSQLIVSGCLKLPKSGGKKKGCLK